MPHNFQTMRNQYFAARKDCLKEGQLPLQDIALKYSLNALRGATQGIPPPRLENRVVSNNYTGSDLLKSSYDLGKFPIAEKLGYKSDISASLPGYIQGSAPSLDYKL